MASDRRTIGHSGSDNSRTSFAAQSVGILEPNDCDGTLVLVLEEGEAPGHRLEIQRALEFDQQDINLGMDTYCLVTESGATHYGGIQDWVVNVNQVDIELDLVACQQLGTSGFLIDIEPAKIDAVKHALRRLTLDADNA